VTAGRSRTLRSASLCANLPFTQSVVRSQLSATRRFPPALPQNAAEASALSLHSVGDGISILWVPPPGVFFDSGRAQTTRPATEPVDRIEARFVESLGHLSSTPSRPGRQLVQVDSERFRTVGERGNADRMANEAHVVAHRAQRGTQWKDLR